MMTVPDRILLAGNNAHVAARGTTRPRELQLEKSIVPNHSPEHVRVYTPPRSIRLDDNSAFPSAARLAGTDFRSGHYVNYIDFLFLGENNIDLARGQLHSPGWRLCSLFSFIRSCNKERFTFRCRKYR